MKIAHISDPHEDLEAVDRALAIVKASDIDVLAISGDLGAEVFSKQEETAFSEAKSALCETARYLASSRKRTDMGIYGMSSDELIKFIRAYSKDDPERICEAYLRYERLFHQRRRETYEQYKKRFNELKPQVILVPGNWDSEDLELILSKENIHLKGIEIKGIKFTGYGGANQSSGIPREFAVRFDQGEAFEYLSAMNEADVILTHDCPWGYEGGHVMDKGNGLLLAHLYRRKPKLILSGHTHNLIAKRNPETNTIVIGSGALGMLYEASPEMGIPDSYMHIIQLNDKGSVSKIERITMTAEEYTRKEIKI